MKKSFLKWSETNYPILDDLIPLIQSFRNSKLEQAYVEPFLGSGSVFLNVESYTSYILNDLNVDIFMLFSQIKNNSDLLISDIENLFVEDNNNKTVFKKLLLQYNKTNSYYEKCKIFLYLNRHGRTDSLRFNQDGKYKQSFAKNTYPYLPKDEIELMNKKLNTGSVLLFNHNFETIFENLEYADVVYCDPPNINQDFDVDKHMLLNQLATSSSLKGSRIIISNEYNEIIKELYKDCSEYYIKKIKTSRKNKEEMIAIYA